MRKVSLFKRLALCSALFAAGAATIVSFGTTATVEATSCVSGTKYTDFTGSVTGKDTLTVRTKDDSKLCNDVDVHFATFVIHNDYNGKGFSKNPTALPQTQFYIKTVTLKKGTNGLTTQKVQIPDACTNYQIDAYIGKIQTEIKTSEGFIGTNAITSELYQKTKTDCSIPKVKACNSNTRMYEMVEKGKENTPPYTTNFDNCETVTVCNTKTGKIEKDITKEQAKDPKYSGINDIACNPPEKVRTCDTKTGTYVSVEKGKENTSPYSTNFDNCETAIVCNTKTGKIEKDISKEQAKDSKYAPQDDEACKPPKEIPSTGPVEIVSGIIGTGLLAGASSMYLKSRRSLLDSFRK